MGGRKPDVFDYDLIAIGSGAGGSVASHIIAGQGKKVAIVEEDKPGGECPNYGCVPTKALLQAADTFNTALKGNAFGIRSPGVTANHTAIMRWKDKAIARTGVDHGEAMYEEDGIHVIKGRAHFLSPYEISVGGRRFSARKFILATGTTNAVPPIPGLGDAGFITHRQAIDLKPPHTLVIIGGGPIGCEFAHIFNSFGSKVVILERLSRLIAHEDPEVGDIIKDLFEADGIDVQVGANVSGIRMEKGKKVVSWESSGKTKTVRADEILLAAGMRPNTDLGLENAGVKYDARGIKVNDRMQTSAKHIYAAGDVAGPFAFTHMASYQSRIAAHNMFSSNKVSASYKAVPRCIFTWPEVAAVGLTEFEIAQQKISVEKVVVPISVIGRSNTSNFRDGFVKVIVSKQSKKIIGAAIVAPRAGEMIHELGLAINHGLTADDVASTIHAFPTWSEAVRVACAQLG